MRETLKFQPINKKALSATLVFFILFTAIIFIITTLQIKQQEQEQLININNRFLDFQQNMKSFIMKHSTLLYGFSAFINTFDVYEDEKIYQFLENLISKSKEYIRNIGILKDTTIQWNYPREDNASAIGVNLLNIKEQAPAILKVKENLQSTFTGPINLIQGGTGYIIRVPVLKDNVYWGMVSIVIKGDKFISYLDDISWRTQLKVLIQDQESQNELMYGDSALQETKSYQFTTLTDFGQWIFFVAPMEGWKPNIALYFLAALALILFLNIPGSYLLYNYVKHNFETKTINRHLQKSAGTDKLTGIPNRSDFEPFIMQQINYAQRHSTPLTVFKF